MRLSGRKASSYAPRWRSRQRIALFSLLGLNLALYLTQLVVQAYRPGLVTDYLGLSYRGIDQAYSWEFLTALGLQAGFLSFAGGMFLLYFAGRDVESILGQKHLLYLYLAGGIGGELLHLFLMPMNTVLLAASGGVAAVVAAFATILPELELTQSLFFVLPLRMKAKHIGLGLFGLAAILTMIDRAGVVSHSAWLAGSMAGWLYAHLLGFGHPSFAQRMLWRRRKEIERRRQMSFDEFVSLEIDPLLDKISRNGLRSLNRRERRRLAEVQEKIGQPPH